MGGNSDIRKTNFIRNIEGNYIGDFTDIAGIILARHSESVVNVYDSFFMDNLYKEFLFFSNCAQLSIIGCKIQSTDHGSFQVSVYIGNQIERSIVTMTIYSSKGFHANLPYQNLCPCVTENFYTKLNNLFSLSITCISLFS